MPFWRQWGWSRRAPAAGLVVCLALAAAFVPSTRANPTVSKASEHYEYASLLLKDLQKVPKLELGEEQYALVAKAFRRVYLTDPGSGYCDDSLLAEAEIYRQAAERFGRDPFLAKALTTYRFLAREYPHSKLKAQALRAIEELEGAKQSKTEAAEASEAQKANSGAVEPSAPEAPPTEQARVIPAKLTPVRHQPPTKRSGPVLFQGVRFWSHEDYTRVVIEVDGEIPYRFDRLSRPERLYVDLLQTRLGSNYNRKKIHTVQVDDSFIKQIRIGQNRRSTARVVFDLQQPVKESFHWLSNPVRFVVELRSTTAPDRIVKLPAELAPPEMPAQAEPGESSTVAGAQPLPKGPVESAATAEARRPKPEMVTEAPAASAKQPPKASKDSLSAGLTSAIPSSYPDAAGSPAAVPSTGSSPAASGEFRTVEVEQVASLTSAEADRSLSELSAKPTNAAIARKPEASQPLANGAESDQPPEPVQETVVAKLTPPEPPSVELLEAPQEAKTTSRGKRSLIRALGLKMGRVVIDAGHGGHDTGGIGPGGLREKDLVLDVAMRLGEMIEQKLGATVIYTRTSDRFVPLRERTKLANDSNADLFISVHANSARTRSIRGIETYYLSFTTSSWALAVASRENAAAQRSIHELQDLLSKIALTDKVEESREFAGQVQKALYAGLSSDTKGLRNRGVRKAPFMVLVGAKMPAVLAEVGFLSNPHDEKLLKASAYRQKVATHLLKGVEQYADSLSKVTVTQKQPSSGVD